MDGVHIRVLAGVSMARAAVFAANLGLSGLEFAHGIPGSVGGGLYMNAGAYGGEIRQVAVRTEFLDQEGIHHTLEGEEQGFGYRKSAFTGTSRVIVAGTFALTPGAPEEIRQRMQELMARRKASQPLDLPSAGSTFKRPVGGYAAALIEQAGLKGTQIGRRGSLRQARRICGESGGRNGVGRFGPHCPRSKAGFGNLRHLPGARGGPPLSPCPPERWAIEWACREQNMGQGRKTDGMRKPPRRCAQK